MVKKKRSDADRRVRQCERLGRLLRLLHLIMGKGRWDANALAEELECSRRTVYRLLQTLSVAGVPWYFDESIRAYRVRPGFKFPIAGQVTQLEKAAEPFPADLQLRVERLIVEGETFVQELQQFLETLREITRKD